MPNRLRTALMILAPLVLVAAFGAALAAAKPVLAPNPADDPVLLKKKLDPNRYDGADGCVKRHPKGMSELIRWMKKNTKANAYYGTIRCDGGVHGTGRALDWMLDARKKRQKKLAMAAINTWLAKDKQGRPNALARRMGIQLIIYNCRWWQAGDREWSPYSACGGGRRNADPTQGHIDHIHVELTKPASKLQTSYWEYEVGDDLEVGDDGSGGGKVDESGGISLGRASSSAGEQPHPPLHGYQPTPTHD